MYPIFNRRVDFFQVVRESGENADDYLRRLTSLAEMAMTQEELTTFRFIRSCNDKHLREQIFQLKRKDAMAVSEAVAQYELHQKEETALQLKEVPIAAIMDKQAGQGRQQRRPTFKQHRIPP